MRRALLAKMCVALGVYVVTFLLLTPTLGLALLVGAAIGLATGFLPDRLFWREEQ